MEQNKPHVAFQELRAVEGAEQLGVTERQKELLEEALELADALSRGDSTVKAALLPHIFAAHFATLQREAANEMEARRRNFEWQLGSQAPSQVSAYLGQHHGLTGW